MRDSKSKLAEIIDFCLLSVVSAALSFLFLRTGFKVLPSAIGAIGAAAAIAALFRERSFVGKDKRRSDKQFEDTVTALTYIGESKRLEYFQALLSRFSETHIRGDHLFVGGKRVYCLFLPQSAIAAQICRIHESCTASGEKALLITACAPDAATAAYIAESSTLKTLPQEKLRDLLSDSPLALPKEQKQRGKLKRLLSAALERSMFRRYLMSGALLIGSSYILPRSPLYIAAGAVCFTLALACLLPQNRRKKQRQS